MGGITWAQVPAVEVVLPMPCLSDVERAVWTECEPTGWFNPLATMVPLLAAIAS
jgi:hypothetical protein